MSVISGLARLSLPAGKAFDREAIILGPKLPWQIVMAVDQRGLLEDAVDAGLGLGVDALGVERCGHHQAAINKAVRMRIPLPRDEGFTGCARAEQ